MEQRDVASNLFSFTAVTGTKYPLFRRFQSRSNANDLPPT